VSSRSKREAGRKSHLADMSLPAEERSPRARRKRKKARQAGRSTKDQPPAQPVGQAPESTWASDTQPPISPVYRTQAAPFRKSPPWRGQIRAADLDRLITPSAAR
jgi:hypothetical protein